MCINGRNTAATSLNNYLQQLKGIIISGWPDSRDELCVDLQLYWSYRDKLAVIDGALLKGKCIIIPNSLKEQVLSKLHTNHMGTEKIKLLAQECVYWPSINVILTNILNNVLHAFNISKCSPRKGSCIMIYPSSHGR